MINIDGEKKSIRETDCSQYHVEFTANIAPYFCSISPPAGSPLFGPFFE
jgi:hypothetical protein